MKKGKKSAKSVKGTRIRLRDGIVFRVLEDEAAVVKPEDGTLMILNETGTFILKSIGKGITVERLIRNIMKDYETTTAKTEKDVIFFLKKLEKEGLIEIS